MKKVFAVLAVLFLFAAPASAGEYDAHGVVKDKAGNLISGVWVRVIFQDPGNPGGLETLCITDSNGAWSCGNNVTYNGTVTQYTATVSSDPMLNPNWSPTTVQLLRSFGPGNYDMGTCGVKAR